MNRIQNDELEITIEHKSLHERARDRAYLLRYITEQTDKERKGSSKRQRVISLIFVLAGEKFETTTKESYELVLSMENAIMFYSTRCHWQLNGIDSPLARIEWHILSGMSRIAFASLRSTGGCSQHERYRTLLVKGLGSTV